MFVYQLFTKCFSLINLEAMEKVYYEILEFDQGSLKSIYDFAHTNILDSKRQAEQLYRQKIEQARINHSSSDFKMVLTVIEDYQTIRHILNDSNSDLHLMESLILSRLTGQDVEIPPWPLRKARFMNE